MFKQYRHIHFVGIGGIGMSGIAEVLLNLGYTVSGSDLKSSATTQRLKRRGATVFYGHKAEYIDGAHVVVVTSAVNEANVEVAAAHAQHIPVVPRAEMLAELMRLKYGVAVAGTHGKTTTTSLIASTLAAGQLDPTIIIGGKVNAWRSNARLGKGEFLVAEADESDGSFLKLSPTIAVVTNIDPEHMETYRSFAAVRRAYASFIEKTPFYGAVVACVDHPEVRRLVKACSRPILTYGIEQPADYRAVNIRQQQEKLYFDVEYQGEVLGEIVLPLPGQHNILNALAAVAVGCFLQVDFATIARSLAKFKGIERRFEVLCKTGPYVVNDYAHHPVEIAATIQAVRDGWPGRRVVVAHQPHRYSRLHDLHDDFVDVLAQADQVYLTKVYAAGEKPIKGVSSRSLCTALKSKLGRACATYVDEDKQLLNQLEVNAADDDVVLFLGAGDIWKMGADYAKVCRPRGL